MLPSYATTLVGKGAEQLHQEIAAPAPVVEVDLAELRDFQWKCRGVYETTWPTLAGDLTLKMGQKYTVWLDREPDWTQSRKGRAQPFVMMYELLPVSPPGEPQKLMIYRWKLMVRGEAEARERVKLEAIRQAALAAPQENIFVRMENA